MRKPDVDFRALDDLLVPWFGPRQHFCYERTSTGVSTPVYRLLRGSETFYVRIAEESAASFAPEVEVHTRLTQAGVRVPEIIHYEPFSAALQRSVVVTTEIPGTPIEASTSPADVAKIARDAGRDLAHIHAIPVEGFGWLSREHAEPGWPLRGEFRTHAEFVNPRRAAAPLVEIGFSAHDAERTERLLSKAAGVGPSGRVGMLAHGDFDISHMFGDSGAYTGIIDFGEIRGTAYTFDFATLWLQAEEEPAATAFRNVEAGYSEVRPLPDDHDRQLYLAGVLSAAQRLSGWFYRDGHQATTRPYFQWLAGRLQQLLAADGPAETRFTKASRLALSPHVSRRTGHTGHRRLDRPPWEVISLIERSATKERTS